ncbi:glycosyltransferase family 4 protein [Candidatus Bipolaricaulota bacterium]
MKILHVCSDTAYGCLAAVSELAIAQVNLGLDVEVMLIREEGQVVSAFRRNRMESSGVRTHLDSLPRLRSWMRPRIVCRGASVIAATSRLLRYTSNCDLVHGHGGLGCICAYGAARYRRIPVVATRHGLEPGPLHTLAWRFLLTRVDRYVSLLPEDNEHLYKANSTSLGDIPRNGIDATAWRGLKSAAESLRGKFGIPLDGFVVGVVGRLAPEKQQAFFLRALASHSREAGGVHVLVIGEGPSQTEVQASARSLGCEDKVSFLGFVDDMPAAYRSLDLIVMTSTRESQSMVVLEAMAAGVPVVATDVGGTPWLLGDGAGWLVSPLDEAALVHAIEALRREPARRQALADNARQRVEDLFDSMAAARDYLQKVYNPVLGIPVMECRSSNS